MVALDHLPRRRFVLALLLAGLALPGGCDRSAKSNRPRVAYVTNGVDSFWVIAEAGAKAGGRQYDADVEVHMPAQGMPGGRTFPYNSRAGALIRAGAPPHTRHPPLRFR